MEDCLHRIQEEEGEGSGRTLELARPKAEQLERT